MFRTLLVCLAACVATATAVAYEPPLPAPKSSRNLPAQFIEQRLDNFNPQNLATFNVAFYENDQFHVPNGPLFVYIGGEWTANPRTLLGGHMFDMAREFNGSQLYPEHRFYGLSIPGDLSVDRLRFLTVEQALADLANFIRQIRRRPQYAGSKVVLVGASYAATMAAWFRQQYPHLAVGAWASSAPVHAQVDFLEYKEAVADGMRRVGGDVCGDRLVEAFAAAEQLISEQRYDEFVQVFGLCDDFGTHPLDVAHALYEFSDIFAGVVQSNRIQFSCDSDNKDESALQSLGRFVRSRWSTGCRWNYARFVAHMRNETHLRQNERQWLYQSCTEFGWFQTSTSADQPFGSRFPIDLFHSYCMDIFGYQFEPLSIRAAVARTNVAFGSRQLAVRNVYFTNGDVDPWRLMSVLGDVNESSPADLIPGEAHCKDLASVHETDSAEMKAVRERITGLVRQWLAE